MTVADGRSDSGELAPTIRGPVGLQLASGLTLDLITPKPTRSVHLLDQPLVGLVLLEPDGYSISGIRPIPEIPAGGDVVFVAGTGRIISSPSRYPYGALKDSRGLWLLSRAFLVDGELGA